MSNSSIKRTALLAAAYAGRSLHWGKLYEKN
jgi:hypothetical protein